MQPEITLMLLFVAIAGSIGGVVNALITDNGFLMPKKEEAPNGNTIVRPGYIGNIVIGAVAATVSWCLYGPLSTYLIVGTSEAMKLNATPQNVGISLASFAGGILVGVGGARWLSSEVDKMMLRAAAVQAASIEPSNNFAQQLSLATPAKALEAAMLR